MNKNSPLSKIENSYQKIHGIIKVDSDVLVSDRLPLKPIRAIDIVDLIFGLDDRVVQRTLVILKR